MSEPDRGELLSLLQEAEFLRYQLQNITEYDNTYKYIQNEYDDPEHFIQDKIDECKQYITDLESRLEEVDTDE